MVQPRSQQIKDVQTRYSALAFSPSQQSSQTVIPAATVHAATISDVPGGVEQDASALIFSPSLEPYPIVGGDAINVAVDGGLNVVVTFVSGDTTASKVAARVNAAVGSAVSGNDNGHFYFQSLTTGPTSKFVISDNVPGTLAKIGLVASTVVGKASPVRGILTVAQDRLGGYVPLKTTDGRNVVTDTDYLVQNTEGFIPFSRFSVPPGGTPVHGRLTFNGTDYNLSYYARMKTRPEIITSGSTFALLDNTDSLTFAFPNVFGNLIVTFPAGPGLTRTQVIDRINAQWAALAAPFQPNGAAHVSGSIIQPFQLNSLQIAVAVDGGVAQPVIFTPGTTITDIVNALNSQVTGITASDGGGFVVVRSNNPNGRTSSLSFYDVLDSNNLALLGIQGGTYRGYFIAEPYGPSEIVIRGNSLGSAFSVVVTGPSQTQQRLGVPAGSYSGSDDAEFKVNLPAFNNATAGFIAIPSTDPYPLVALIPEVLEFGEVDPASESVTEKFGLKSAGSNVDPLDDALFFTDFNSAAKYGSRTAGKPIIANQKGEIHLKFLGGLLNYVQNVFSQIAFGTLDPSNPTAAVVNGLVGSGIATPGTDGNNGTPSATFTIFVDADNTFPGSRQFRVTFHADASPYTPFRVVDSDLIPGLPLGGGAIDAGQSSLFGNAINQLAFYDANTLAAGIASGGRGYMLLSAEDQGVGVEGDMYLRVLDKDTSGVSTVLGSPFRRTILKKLNSIECSVGDGTNSFGDFNGANAIQKAVAFANATYLAGVWSMTIHVKHGTYTSISDIIIPTFSRLILVGEDCGPSFLTLGTSIVGAGGDSLIQTSGAGYLECRNIRFQSTTVNFAFVDLTASVSDQAVFKDCFFNGVGIKAASQNKMFLDRCTMFASSTPDQPLIRLDYAGVSSGLGLTVRDSFLRSGNNNPVLKIRSTGAGSGHTGRIAFENCTIFLGSTTVDGANNMIGNCGLVDLDPNGFDGIIAGQGAVVDELAFVDCQVTANDGFGAVTCLLHLIPCTNGTRTNASPFVEGTHAGMKVLKFVISGGRWTATRTATAVNPFTVGLAWIGLSGGSPVQPVGGRVLIEDVIFEFDQAGSSTFNMGSATQDCGSFFANSIAGSSAPTQAIWGAFAFAANDLYMRNVRILGNCQQGGCGDIFIKANFRASIEDILITDYKLGTSGTLATNRARFRFGFLQGGPIVSVRRFVMSAQSAPTGQWAQLYTIALEPSVTPVEYDDMQALYFDATLGLVTGIALLDAPAVPLYTGQINVWSTLRILRPKVVEGLFGIRGAFTNLAAVGSVDIIDPLIEGTGNYAISIITSGSLGLGDILVQGASITGCTVNPAVYLAADQWGGLGTGNGIGFARIINNRVYSNGNVTNEQIQVALTTAAGADDFPRFIIKDNWCGNPVFAGIPFAGKIRSNARLSSAIVSLNALEGVFGGFLTTYTIGLESAYTVPNSPLPTFTTVRHMVNGAFTLHNFAVLFTP